MDRSPDVRIFYRTLHVFLTYPVVKENGQKKFGPPREWPCAPPPQGSEVFVGHLPRSFQGEALLRLFCLYGTVYQLRLMMDFSGLNRGFAFVLFDSPQAALLASQQLNEYQIAPGHKIGVVISKDNRCISIDKLPVDMSSEDVVKFVSQYHSDSSTIRKVTVTRDEKAAKAILEYQDHRSAAMARRDLWVAFEQLGTFTVDWSSHWTQPNTILHVNNMRKGVSKGELEDLFSFGRTLRLKQVRTIKDYAFIQFASHSGASNALQLANLNANFGSHLAKLGARRLNVSWSTSECSSRQINKKD